MEAALWRVVQVCIGSLRDCCIRLWRVVTACLGLWRRYQGYYTVGKVDRLWALTVIIQTGYWDELVGRVHKRGETVWNALHILQTTGGGGGGASPGDNFVGKTSTFRLVTKFSPWKFFAQFDKWLTVTVTGCLACPISGSL